MAIFSLKRSSIFADDLCSSLKSEPLGKNWVTIDRLGGSVTAPMNKSTLGCRNLIMMEISMQNSCTQQKATSGQCAARTFNSKITLRQQKAPKLHAEHRPCMSKASRSLRNTPSEEARCTELKQNLLRVDRAGHRELKGLQYNGHQHQIHTTKHLLAARVHERNTGKLQCPFDTALLHRIKKRFCNGRALWNIDTNEKLQEHPVEIPGQHGSLVLKHSHPPSCAAQ